MRIQGLSRESLQAETARQLALRPPRAPLGEIIYHFLGVAGVLYRLTEEHVERVAIFAEKMARKLNLDFETIYLAGLLHDIGKLICPDALFDGHNIDATEMTRVKKHALASFLEIQKVDLRIAAIIGIHHAVYDNGYGLSLDFLRKHFSPEEAEEIIILGAVVSVCDWIDSRLCRRTELHEPSEGMTPGDCLRIKYRRFPEIVREAIAEARELYGVDLNSEIPFPADQA